MKVVVVGAGIAGLTSAVVLKEKGHQVEVFEKRSYVGGLCHDSFESGVLFQYHGPHIFHTDDRRVRNFIKRYATLYPFHHVVWARTDIGMFPIPFCKKSARIVGDLSPKRLTELVFKGYSQKHWGLPWEDLPLSVRKRVPVKRESEDDRYTLDTYQGVPLGGYARMFEAMAEGLSVHLSVESDCWRSQRADLVVYTGRLDEYFHSEHGALGYRSARMIHRKEPPRKFAIVNECMLEVPWTRSTDHSHWTDNTDIEATLVTYEYPCGIYEAEPLYPVEFGSEARFVRRYRKMASKEKNTVFVGRMATHRYLDMHVVVKQAMEAFG